VPVDASSFSIWYRMTVPLPLVSWWRARIVSICDCHSSVAVRYPAASVRALPARVASHAGNPPPSVSALMYGPGRAMT